MSSTTIGVQFDVMDLNASYEVVGTSDNYSFSHKLGVGKKLVDQVGDTCEKIVPLYGNYGVFDVRVFAVSQIGIRSEFIQDTISISAPEFDGTFTFSNLRVNNLPEKANIGSINKHTPLFEGDELIVESEFIDKNIQLKWELIPPVGHASEGKAVATELLSDTFFDHFEIKIYAGQNKNLVSTQTLNDSPSLEREFNAADPAEVLDFYRDFTLNLNQSTFQDLSLERVNSVEIVAYDSFGRTCTGLLTGINYEPNINSFSSNIKGSKTSFSWSVQDTDFRSVRVSGIALPKDKSLYSSNSIGDNYNYYNKLNAASDWKNIPNKIYQANQFIKYTDNFVYRAKSQHTASVSRAPSNSTFWEKLEQPFDDFFLVEGVAEGNSFSHDQIFGLSYYYGIQSFDGFGEGINYNVSADGLTNNGDLIDFTSFIKIENFVFREREDDLIFSWDLVDNDGNSVDISNKRFVLTESDTPQLLGFSGHLFDADTERFVHPITLGNDARSASTLEDNTKVINEELHNAKIFNSYEYTREINNEIYKRGGFPENLTDFDNSIVYSPGNDPEYAIDFNEQIFEIKAANSITTPYIRPTYEDWASNRNYINRSSNPYSDVVRYLNDIYTVNQNFGPEYCVGFFNENNSYSAGDLVVFPNVSAEVFDSSHQYFIDNLVLYNGEVYKALKNQSEGNAVTPDLSSSYWAIAQESVDYSNAVYEAQNNLSSPIAGSPILDRSNWVLKTPDNSSAFSLVAAEYSDEQSYSINDLVFYEDIVYKALQNNPTDSPVYAITESGGANNINYINSKWMPIWERSTNYDEVIFGHIGIPESGKRSIGLEISLLDNNGRPIETQRKVGINPHPVILDNGFNVDSFGRVTQTRFNFNYAFGSQEKTTKVHLYRSDSPNFSILDSNGLAGTGAPTFIKQVLGAADSTFGTNINSIIDESPPIGDEITGYYYKILPFDDFGSGDLYSVDDFVKIYPKIYSNSDPSVPPGPISENLKDNYVPGAVENFTGDTAFENYFLNWDAPSTTMGNPNLIPRDLEHYEIWASDDSYLNFPSLSKHLTHEDNTGYHRIGEQLSSFGPIPLEDLDPADGIGNASNILNISAGSRTSLDAIYKGQTNQRKYFWIRPVDRAGNKGPFVGDSVNNGPTTDVEGLNLVLGQMETTDVADFEQNITEAFPKILSLIPNNPFENNKPNTQSVSWERHFVYYNGTGYVIGPGNTDKAFIYWSATGQTPTHGEDIVALTLEEKEELGLVGLNGILLDDVQGGPRSIRNPLRNVVYSGNYDTSSYHPAGEGRSVGVDENKPSLLGPEHDFIIARNSAGIATPMWHAFANATIGTAHIQNAAITNAKIHNLTADKIRSAEIFGQDIQVGGDSLSGQIRSAGFPGLVEPASSQPDGFAISGDGSFVFAADNGRLYFDDGDLTIEGNIRQKDGTEFTLMSLSCEPNYFDYVEDASNALVPQDASASSKVSAYYRNSSVDADQVRFKITSPGGYEYVSYSDHNNGKYDISGFKYDPTLTSSDANFSVHGGFDDTIKKATAVFDVTGFDAMIQSQNPSFLSSLVIFASGIEQGIEHVNSISLLSDGAPGPTGRSPVFRGIWSSGKDYVGVLGGSNEAEELRGDVVYSNTDSNYYIAINSSGPSSVGDKDPSVGANSYYWRTFGAQFQSVATNLLLAEDAIITRTLTMGEGELNPSNQYVGHGGIIKTVGKEYGNGVTGFFLGNELENNLPNPKFDVGSDESYIRFNGQENKIEIKGTLTLNDIPSTDISFDSLDGPNATFIGGGYNHIITGYGGFHGLASSIVGGAYNNITGRFSSVVGGFDNNVGDNFSIICAGYRNEMPESTSGHAGANMIGAGSYNKIEGGSLQSITAGKYNYIEYDPAVIDFGTYVNNTYSAEDRSVVFDYDFSALSSKILGRFGEKAIISGVAPSQMNNENAYIVENSKLAKEVHAIQSLFRGDTSAFNDNSKWLSLRKAFYNHLDLYCFIVPNFRGSEYDYHGVWSSPMTIAEHNAIPNDKLVFYDNKYWRRISSSVPSWQSGQSYDVNDLVYVVINAVTYYYYCNQANADTISPEQSSKWTAGQPDPGVSDLYVEEASPELKYWAYFVGSGTLSGWVYISSMYSSNGHWLFVDQLNDWIWIYNGFTDSNVMGKCYSNSAQAIINLT